MNPKAIDRLFYRLASTYGASWERSLGGTPVLDAKALWAHELQVFAGLLEAVVWALDHLPEYPPNVIQFRNLCRQAPATEVPQLPAPQADPARVAAELAKLGALRQATTRQAGDMKEWAKRLAARDQAGEKLSRYQRHCYQAALGVTA